MLSIHSDWLNCLRSKKNIQIYFVLNISLGITTWSEYFGFMHCHSWENQKKFTNVISRFFSVNFHWFDLFTANTMENINVSGISLFCSCRSFFCLCESVFVLFCFAWFCLVLFDPKFAHIITFLKCLKSISVRLIYVIQYTWLAIFYSFIKKESAISSSHNQRIETHHQNGIAFYVHIFIYIKGKKTSGILTTNWTLNITLMNSPD